MIAALDDVGPAEGDDKTFNIFMKTIEPLIVTFKILGGYFEIREDTKSTNRCNSFWKRWNFWRVYATLVLVLGWADFIRYCFAITKDDSFGPSLLLKMNFFGLLIVGAFNRTVSYVAFSNGKYRKTLLEISNLHFQKEKITKIHYLAHGVLLVWSCGHFCRVCLPWVDLQRIGDDLRLSNRTICIVLRTEPQPNYIRKCCFYNSHKFRRRRSLFAFVF